MDKHVMGGCATGVLIFGPWVFYILPWLPALLAVLAGIAISGVAAHMVWWLEKQTHGGGTGPVQHEGRAG